jgi:hypothetical protein
MDRTLPLRASLFETLSTAELSASPVCGRREKATTCAEIPHADIFKIRREIPANSSCGPRRISLDFRPCSSALGGFPTFDGAVNSPSERRAPSPSPLDIVSPELLNPPDIPIRGGSRTDAGVVLDRELVALASMESFCRLIIARIARRLIETRAWRPLGFVRLSDYARERAGVSPRTLEEDARVVRALDSLPAMRGMLELGKLSWTKLRLLVRVANAENQHLLIQQAMTLTCRDLEAWIKTLHDNENTADAAAEAHAGANDTTQERNRRDSSARGNDNTDETDNTDNNTDETRPTRDGTADADDPEVAWSITISRGGRRLWRLACELASRSAGAPLRTADVLELVAAEAMSGLPPRHVGLDAAWEPGPEQQAARLLHLQRHVEDRGRRTILQFLAETGVCEGFAWLEPGSGDPGPARALEKLSAGLAHADAFELDRRLREASAAMNRIDRQMAALLRIGIDRRLFREIGFATVKLYVESRLGCSARKIWSLVAIERESWRSCAALRVAWHEGRISHLAASVLLPVISEKHGEEWIRRASEVTLRRLQDEVAWALDQADRCEATRPSSPPPFDADVRTDGLAGVTSDEVQMRAHGEVPRSLLGPAGAVRLAFHIPVSVAAMVESALFCIARPGEMRWRVFERMLALAVLEWTATPRHRDPIFERDGWRCSVPACSSRRNLHDHHVTFRSHGGSNSQGNRTTVCADHHLHGLHAGVVRATGEAPSRLVWELGCIADREPLMRLHGDRYAA